MRRTNTLYISMLVLLTLLSVMEGQSFAGETDATVMLNYIAQTTGIPTEDLVVTRKENVNLPLTGKEFSVGKVIDKTGREAYAVAVDKNGNVVDHEALQANEKAAYRAKYGKLAPALYDLLDLVGDEDKLMVAVWLRSDTMPAPVRPVLNSLPPPIIDLPAATDLEKKKGSEKERVAAMATAIKAQQAEQRAAIKAARKANAQALSAQIAAVQQPLLDELNSLGITPAYVSTSAPLVYVELPKSAIANLAERYDIDTLYGPYLNFDVMDIAKPTQKANIVDEWWSFDGAGIDVAILEDSRIEFNNPYLNDGVTRVPGSANVDQHATATAGMVASQHATYQGIAQGVSLFSANATDYSDANLSAAMDWAAITQDVDVINNSWGGNVSTTDLNVHDRHLDYIVRNYWKTVTVAAGNENDGCGGGTGRVASPARGYNMISVGNYDDNGTLTWDDDFMDACSSYVNPSTNMQKPEVAASGSNITSTTHLSPWIGGVGSGTSYSAPMVAGEAALLLERDSALDTWPEIVKAIIMASALHNIEGYTLLSDYDGAGGVDMRAAFVIADNYWRNGYGPIDATAFPITEWIYATAGEKARAAIAWDSNPSSDYSTDPLEADIDLRVYDPNGSLLTFSASSYNSYEIVEFTAPITGWYEINIDDWYFPAGKTTYLGSARWPGNYRLTAYTPETFGTPPVSRGYFSFDAPLYWNAVGIRSPVGADYDITLYSSSAFGDPADYTWREDSTTTSTVDFVVVDRNHAPAGLYYPEVSAYSGSGSYLIEWAYHSADTAIYGPYTMAPGQIVRVWDSWLTAGVRKYFAVKPTSGDADLGIALFGSDPANSATWYQGKSTAIAVADSSGAGSSEYMNYQASIDDWMGLVVWNNGATSSTTFYLYTDDSAPTGSISINSGAIYTSSTSVTLTLSATDSDSGVSQMRFSNDNSTWSAWEPYATTKAWTLTAGDGTKTVYVQYENNAGMVSSSYSDSIILDTILPTCSILINGGADFTTSQSVTLALSATDSGSGVFQMRFSNDNSTWSAWEPYATTKAWWLIPADNGFHTVYVQYKDNAGNVSSCSDTIYLDTILPTCSILINGGAATTTSQSVTLTLSASDLNGVFWMRFSNDNSTWSAWEPYVSTKAWTLTPGYGNKTVYVNYMDGAGNVSSCSDTIEYIAQQLNNRLLWKHTTGEASLWTLDSSDNLLSMKSFGPFTNWVPIDYHRNSDGTGKLLWQNTTGEACLWTLDASGTLQGMKSFGPFTNWVPLSYDRSNDGTGRILWKNISGEACIWTLDASDNYVSLKSHGPFADWQPIDYDRSADGSVKLLWKNTSGAASIWTLDALDAYVSYITYGPYANWAPINYDKSADGKGRLLWKDTTGAANIWTLNSSDTPVSSKTYGPYANWAPIDYDRGTDDSGKLLWKNTSGEASIWTLDSSSDTLVSMKSYGPFSGWAPLQYK